MAKLSDLPNELHAHIFKLHLESIETHHRSDNENDTSHQNKAGSGKYEWGPHDNYTKATLPINAASVCRLWHDILAEIPDCWTRVVFDVSEDPSPFLDIFSWSKDLVIDAVYVRHNLNSRSGAGLEFDEEEAAAIEGMRVREILEAMRPHIHRCQKITFDIVFETSLPSPIVFLMHESASSQLEGLVLRYQEGNMPQPFPDPGCTTSSVADCCRAGAPKPAIPAGLMDLSISGFWFMYLAMHPHTSHIFANTPSTEDDHPPRNLSFETLTISDFEFNMGVYSVENFLTALCTIRSQVLQLADLSVEDEDEDEQMPAPPITRRDSPLYLWGGYIVFTRASRWFLTHLDAVAVIEGQSLLKFDECGVPLLTRKHRSAVLEINNVIDLDSDEDLEVTVPESPITSYKNSVKNALQNWMGYEFRAYNCYSFDDDLLLWLYRVPEDPAVGPAPHLCVMKLKECVKFSPRTLLDYIDSKTECVVSSSVNAIDPLWESTRFKMDILEVTEGCPGITDDQIEWLRENTDMKVHWAHAPMRGGEETSQQAFQMMPKSGRHVFSFGKWVL